MARVTRRKFLKASGAGALAAKTGGMAGILAASKAPAYAQATTVHWLKWADFVPAGDQILRESMLAEAEKALGFMIKLETIGLNDLQARATAAIQTGAGPDIIMIFDNKAQLYADSVADVSAVCEAIGSSQGGYYDLAKANTHDGKSGLPCPIASSAPWSPIANRGSTRSASPSSPRPGRVSGRRQEAQGQGPSYRADPRSRLQRRAGLRLPLLWSCGGRRSRLTARRSTSTARRRSSRSSSCRILEGGPRRERPCLGRQQQQPRVPVGHDQRHQQRSLDLHRGAAQARSVPDRKGHAAQGRHPARTLPKGPAGLGCIPPDPDADEVFEEPEGREGFPALVHSTRSSRNGSCRRRVSPFRSREGMVEASAVERGSHHGAVPRRILARARLGMPGPSGRKGCRSGVEIHHHRHVRQSRAGHVGRGRGEMGRRRSA